MPPSNTTGTPSGPPHGARPASSTPGPAPWPESHPRPANAGRAWTAPAGQTAQSTRRPHRGRPPQRAASAPSASSLAAPVTRPPMPPWLPPPGSSHGPAAWTSGTPAKPPAGQAPAPPPRGGGGTPAPFPGRRRSPPRSGRGLPGARPNLPGRSHTPQDPGYTPLSLSGRGSGVTAACPGQPPRGTAGFRSPGHPPLWRGWHNPRRDTRFSPWGRHRSPNPPLLGEGRWSGHGFPPGPAAPGWQHQPPPPAAGRRPAPGRSSGISPPVGALPARSPPQGRFLGPEGSGPLGKKLR